MERLKKGRFANLIHDAFTSYEYTRRLYGFREFISLCGRILEYKKLMDLRTELHFSCSANAALECSVKDNDIFQRTDVSVSWLVASIELCRLHGNASQKKK